ncbi:MAG: choice-of-anchor tandem repeat GloVer-containing protein [Candidatus Cybelea sp.]
MNGALYGTTTRGGISGHGTVFSISAAGVYKVLYHFRGGSDGSDPQAGLTDLNGTLYGTTPLGGYRDKCCKV